MPASTLEYAAVTSARPFGVTSISGSAHQSRMFHGSDPAVCRVNPFAGVPVIHSRLWLLGAKCPLPSVKRGRFCAIRQGEAARYRRFRTSILVRLLSSRFATHATPDPAATLLAPSPACDLPTSSSVDSSKTVTLSSPVLTT